MLYIGGLSNPEIKLPDNTFGIVDVWKWAE